jgi:hypothetical protein
VFQVGLESYDWQRRDLVVGCCVAPWHVAVLAQLQIELVPHVLIDVVLNSKVTGRQRLNIPLLEIQIGSPLQIGDHDKENNRREGGYRSDGQTLRPLLV